ncbi:hypothetical protein SAMN05192534_13614 [Alteribacillus persepolensis]|uniref:TIR domain-containing protein n=1 Tax=Alteribacillus persepolensis TaxID=568899 RepID=A0A1G8JRK4_9BACI|nr:toll/interleukin-1 receptor domain-containing protein [Alteribacillus persepolensis]SDI33848.1 hypothetical protein SAMN05192534_13614 [Alteribacillus persepolensis]
MFAGFNLTWDSTPMKENLELGTAIFQQMQGQVKSELAAFIQEDHSLDGTKMRESWFPFIQADVFLSHSHADKEKALALAGWLKQTFDLNVFIDSCVWGFADNLLKTIDDHYCKNKDGFYRYQLRNQSTSHVHMMLATALAMMIDKTECLFLLNTPNAIETKHVINQTKSPWIYLETALTKFMRKQPPAREKVAVKKSAQDEASELTINYKVDIEHLPKISEKDMREWKAVYEKMKKQEISNIHPLDLFYHHHGFIDRVEMIHKLTD